MLAPGLKVNCGWTPSGAPSPSGSWPARGCDPPGSAFHASSTPRWLMWPPESLAIITGRKPSLTFILRAHSGTKYDIGPISALDYPSGSWPARGCDPPASSLHTL
ncbi:hypothetical protein GCM10010429_48780 [Micromonospora olivasterospora]